MKITLFNDEGQEIFTGTPRDVAEGLRSGEISRADLVGLERVTEVTPSPAAHNEPWDRIRRCHLLAAAATVRGDRAACLLWMEREGRVNDSCGGRHNPLAYGDSLLALAREAKCSEKEINSHLESYLGFEFTEPETAKVARVEFGLSCSPVYVLFDNGSCYTHETKVSAGTDKSFCSASWGGTDGLFVGGARVYKIQPRRHDWIRGFLDAAYAANKNPLPILREITGWDWKMNRSHYGDGTSSVHYSMPDEAIRHGREWPAISKSDRGCHNSGSGFFIVETAEAKRLQAINEKFRSLPMEGAAEEVADWLDGFNWRNSYKPRTVARFLREHWSGRTIRVDIAIFSADAAQGPVTSEGWKFLHEGERIACFSPDGFFNNLGLKTPDKLTATPVTSILFGQGPVGI